jgi:hypothetical protein
MIVYLRDSTTECIMEEAMLDFFYNGISPWIKKAGYKWYTPTENVIARKFLKFSYELYCAVKETNIALYPPEPIHRDLPEDRETFDMYLDTPLLIELLNIWSFRTEIVGTRLDYMIKEFCYVWLDVTSGKPGKWTYDTLNMNNEPGSEDDHDVIIPDGNWSRRTHDLY